MSSEELKTSPQKKPPELSFFTVMISRGLGKVRSFNISFRFLIWSSIVFSLYLIFSVVAINLYFGELRSNKAQSDIVQQLQHEMEETKRALYQAKQRLKLLDEYVYAKSHGPEGVNQLPEKPVVQKKIVENSAMEKYAEPVITIKGLTTKRSNGKLSVKFRLAKAKPGGNQVTGYLFMIAAKSESDLHQIWTHPKVAIKDGVPVSYKHGQLFKVRNYKIIRGKFFFDPRTDTPSLLRIMAYDTSGKLILNKAFTIEEAP